MVSEKESEEAVEHGRIHQLAVPCAVAARYDASTGMITVDLNRGFSVSFHKERSQTLCKASDEELSQIEIEGSGHYIIFPKLDDGFTVLGMLAGRFGNRHWEQQWADEHKVEIAENTLSEPVYAVMVERTAAQLNQDSSDVIF